MGGGIPCIKALKEGIAANNITYAAGIMNGAHDSLSLSLFLSQPRKQLDSYSAGRSLGPQARVTSSSRR